MGAIRSLRLFLFLHSLVIYADSSPVEKNPQPLRILPFIGKRSDGSSVCEDAESFEWTYKFHDCFIDRKYNDGGRNLNSIIDRILDHGEACIETSSSECRPDFRGFRSLLNKTITQMKDYSEMYLEDIYKGREKIKDLGCIETSLNIKTYEDCFHDIVPLGNNLSEEHFQKIVQEGIFCANRRNSGCSKEAKTSLNRIVRIILGVEQPNEEEFEVEIKSTEAPTTKVEIKSTEAPTSKVEIKSTKAPTTKVEIKPTEPPAPEVEQTSEEEFETESEPSYEEEFETKNKPSYEEEFETKIEPTAAPAPWMWYDYLAYPFVQAWKWVSGLFG